MIVYGSAQDSPSRVSIVWRSAWRTTSGSSKPRSLVSSPSMRLDRTFACWWSRDETAKCFSGSRPGKIAEISEEFLAPLEELPDSAGHGQVPACVLGLSFVDPQAAVSGGPNRLKEDAEGQRGRGATSGRYRKGLAKGFALRVGCRRGQLLHWRIFQYSPDQSPNPSEQRPPE
jgi:hypothetical protein